MRALDKHEWNREKDVLAANHMLEAHVRVALPVLRLTHHLPIVSCAKIEGAAEEQVHFSMCLGKHHAGNRQHRHRRRRSPRRMRTPPGSMRVATQTGDCVGGAGWRGAGGEW